jgi:hypothetical protein
VEQEQQVEMPGVLVRAQAVQVQVEVLPGHCLMTTARLAAQAVVRVEALAQQAVVAVELVQGPQVVQVLSFQKIGKTLCLMT